MRPVREELEPDAGFNADSGKRMTGLGLVGEYPGTRLVLEVEERRLPLTLHRTASHETWDGSWEQQGWPGPSPGGVAAVLSTDFMESSGAFLDCRSGPDLDDSQRT